MRVLIFASALSAVFSSDVFTSDTVDTEILQLIQRRSKHSASAGLDCAAISLTPSQDFVDADKISAQEAGAVPFGSSSLPGYCDNTGAGSGSTFGGNGIHCFGNINDGVYGNPSSWIPGSDFDGKRFVGVTFVEAQSVSAFSLARSRTGDHTDRTGGTYELQYTVTPGASYDTPDDAWCSAGTFTRDTASVMGFQLSEPVEATAVRMIVSDSAACIDELEIYKPGAAPGPHCSLNAAITMTQSDAVDGENVALQSAGAVPFGSSSLPNYCDNTGAGAGSTFGGNGIHCFDNINDGVYGNPSSWIPGSEFDGKRFAGVTFAQAQSISAFSLARSRTGDYGDRTGGTYELQYTLTPDASYFTPDADWCSVGTFTRDIADKIGFGLSPAIVASAVRIIVSDSGACIDELEFYKPEEEEDPAAVGDPHLTDMAGASTDLCCESNVCKPCPTGA